MIIDTLVVGSYEVNCYIVACEEHKNGVIIDPGDDSENIVKKVNTLGINVKYIINTHGHGDHIGGVFDIREKFDAKYLIHENSKPLVQADATKDMLSFLGTKVPPQPDEWITGENSIDVCTDFKIKILPTPGHSPGGISLLVEDCLFTGDSLFAGSIGRTDFPLSSHDDLINSIKTKILVLDDNIKVYPGHGTTSTIGHERKYNPFLI